LATISNSTTPATEASSPRYIDSIMCALSLWPTHSVSTKDAQWACNKDVTKNKMLKQYFQLQSILELKKLGAHYQVLGAKVSGS
jgi:hypothetical protein